MYQSSFILKFIRFTVKAALIMSVLLLLFVLVEIVIISINPAESFTVNYNQNSIPGQWYFEFRLNSGQGAGMPLSSQIVQRLREVEENPKIAMMLVLIFRTLPKTIFQLIGFVLINKILKDLFDVSKAFTIKQVKYIKYISVMVLLYFLGFDIMLSGVFNIYTKTHLVQLGNIHVTGLLYAGLVYLLAEVFNYGVYLQQEFDTTL